MGSKKRRHRIEVETWARNSRRIGEFDGESTALDLVFVLNVRQALPFISIDLKWSGGNYDINAPWGVISNYSTVLAADGVTNRHGSLSVNLSGNHDSCIVTIMS